MTAIGDGYHKMFFASVTRISDLAGAPFDIEPVPRDDWAEADYVVCRVPEHPRGYREIELANGRMVKVNKGDRIVGALGTRHATLEAVGSWREVGSDGEMEALTSAGLFGRATSVSLTLRSLLPLIYVGHVQRDGRRLGMTDFVEKAPETPYRTPTILVIGTSMSAGKTTAAKAIVRQLKRLGKRVVGAKLTGAGRYRDILGMSDAGADAIFDFIDVGLPSSSGPPEEFRARLKLLLARISAAHPDVVVAEAGASPLEPYNGQVVLEEMREQVRWLVLCASDPYAVVGVMQGFRLQADLVTGLATSTSAGEALVKKLTGLPAINIKDPEALPQLRQMLERALA